MFELALARHNARDRVDIEGASTICFAGNLEIEINILRRIVFIWFESMPRIDSEAVSMIINRVGVDGLFEEAVVSFSLY